MGDISIWAYIVQCLNQVNYLVPQNIQSPFFQILHIHKTLSLSADLQLPFYATAHQRFLHLSKDNLVSTNSLPLNLTFSHLPWTRKKCCFTLRFHEINFLYSIWHVSEIMQCLSFCAWLSSFNDGLWFCPCCHRWRGLSFYAWILFQCNLLYVLMDSWHPCYSRFLTSWILLQWT